jgi:acyl-CoA thioester hydrolase
LLKNLVFGWQPGLLFVCFSVYLSRLSVLPIYARKKSTAAMNNDRAINNIFPFKVYYADTDAAGIVYYGTYMRWMEMGRCEFFDRGGIDIPKLQEEGFILVVARANLTYHKPARLGDLLQMKIWISELTGLSFKFNYQFLRQEAIEEPTSIVEAYTLMVCVDSQNFQLQSLPEPITQMLDKHTK